MSHPFVPDQAPGRRVVVELGDGLRQNLTDLATALDLPNPAGAELDALTTALRGLDEPLSLVLVGWQYLAVEDPGAWAALRAVLDGAVVANDHLEVLHGPISREGNPALQ
ncbi:barstar family protein [Luteococcus sp. H138]|uniref:barstar family protein n=1 Tax=unclassified Luteococcus TaxID=2639923 RepID=UPI00313E4AC4